MRFIERSREVNTAERRGQCALDHTQEHCVTVGWVQPTGEAKVVTAVSGATAILVGCASLHPPYTVVVVLERAWATGT